MSRHRNHYRNGFLKFLLIFGIGFGGGYYFRGHQWEIKHTAMQRTNRAGEQLKQGAQASGESLKKAAKEIVGDRDETPQSQSVTQ